MNKLLLNAFFGSSGCELLQAVLNLAFMNSSLFFFLFTGKLKGKKRCMDLTHSMLASTWLFSCKTFICVAANTGTEFQQHSACVMQNIWDYFRRDYKPRVLGVLVLPF